MSWWEVSAYEYGPLYSINDRGRIIDEQYTPFVTREEAEAAMVEAKERILGGHRQHYAGDWTPEEIDRTNRFAASGSARAGGITIIERVFGPTGIEDQGLRYELVLSERSGEFPE